MWWHGPAHEAVILENYPQTYATCRGGPDLKALSTTSALIAVWDDHVIADNLWVHGAKAHQPEIQGDWEVRKLAAVRVYHALIPTLSRGALDGIDSGLPFLFQRTTGSLSLRTLRSLSCLNPCWRAPNLTRFPTCSGRWRSS